MLTTAPITDKDKKNVLSLKEEALRWLLSISGALLLFLVVAFIILHTYHPSVPERLTTARELLIMYTNALPEPMEAMLFRCGVITVFFGMLLFYILLSDNRHVTRLAASRYFLPLSILCILSLITLFYLDFAAPDPFRTIPGQTNFNYFFQPTFFGRYIWLYAFVVFPLVDALLFIGIKKHNWDNTKTYSRLLTGIAYPIGIALLLSIIIMNTFSYPYSWEMKNDFAAVYHAATQVHAGMPMLVNGFTDTYGLYPHFLAPLFRVIGLSVTHFSLVMSLLLAAAFIANFLFLRRFVRNKFILFSGFFTLIFFAYLSPRLAQTFDSVFAFFPIRYIIPSILSLLAAAYFNNRSATRYWFITVLMAFFILWNPELGLVCYASWILTNCYYDWYDVNGNVQLSKILFHPAAGICTAISVFYLWKLLIFVCYHSWPDMSLLFSTMGVFENVGFNLLPMALVHPWNIMALIQCTGFLYAIVQWRKKTVSSRAAAILLVSFISLGFFVYFQGGSHNHNFPGATCFTIILLTLLGDELWQKVRADNIFLYNALFLIFLFIVSFSFFDIVLSSGKIYALFYQEDDKAQQLTEQQNFEGNKEFFLSKTTEGQKVHILSARKFIPLYFDGYKRISAINPGLIDMFLNTDLHRMEQNLLDSANDVFIEPYNLSTMPFLERSLAITSATYQVADVHETMYQLHKRTTPIPARSFFTGKDSVIIHRKYTNDATSVNDRIHDAAGIAPVALNNSFSVEVLFYSGVQVFPDATLAGNDTAHNGFVLGKVLYSPNYFFAINDSRYVFPVPFDQWMYIVINVFPDHADMYENGALLATYPLTETIHSFSAPLSIGNCGNRHYFTGPIAEVSITNKPIDNTTLQQTWRSMIGALQK